MSDYFDYTTGRLTIGATARAADVNAIFDAISTGFDKLPSETDIKMGLVNFVSAGGTSSAITATLTYAPTSYTDGMQIILKVTEANPGAATINVNSLGFKDIRRRDGSVLQAGDLGAGNVVPMRYNATSDYFEIEGSMTGDVGSMATQNSPAVSITGGTIDNVTMTGGTVGTHVEATTGIHGAVSTATANKLIIRDSAGRAKVAAPIASTDIALKSTVDDHDANSSTPHSGVLEPAFTKNTAFNKNFGTTSGTVAQGNDSRFLPAYGAVGSYIFAIVYGLGYGVAIDAGDTYSGWAIRPTGLSLGVIGEDAMSVGRGWSDLSGTWRAHGECDAGASRYSGTLFQRIA